MGILNEFAAIHASSANEKERRREGEKEKEKGTEKEKEDEEAAVWADEEAKRRTSGTAPILLLAQSISAVRARAAA